MVHMLSHVLLRLRTAGALIIERPVPSFFLLLSRQSGPQGLCAGFPADKDVRET